MNPFYHDISSNLRTLKEDGNERILREISPVGSGKCNFEGRSFCNLSSNDYLGLAGQVALRKEFFHQFAGDWGSPELALTSSSSRLLTGNTPAYARLEEKLSQLYGGRSALVFNSGYHANTGILPAIARDGDLILSDKLNHASIIDGMRLCKAEFIRYPHADLEALKKILEQKRQRYQRVFLVTESIFSMDGDAVDLCRLVSLKEHYECILLVDEAHAVGVRGPGGAGLCAEQGVADRVDLIIGTFGKAFASTGAYAIMEPALRDFLVNHMRTLIFTTALPSVVLNWSCFMLDCCQTMERERSELRRLALLFRDWFRQAGHDIPAGDTQIIPYIAGEASAAVALAKRFQEHGFLVFAIRPPTVPKGSSRLRFSLNAGLRSEDLEPIRNLL